MLDIPSSWLTLIGIISSAFLVWNGIRASRVDSQLNDRVTAAETQAADQPDKVGPAWALARVTLERYFHRNLNQVKWIFIVAVFVMLAGFAVILYGVGLSMRPGISLEPPRLAALSGVVTEFIGATFIWIYRSTMRQAGEYMNILERINTVGMGVQILESISEQEHQLKDQTKARLVGLLLEERRLTNDGEPAPRGSGRNRGSRPESRNIRRDKATGT